MYNDYMSKLVDVKKEINSGDKITITREILIQCIYESIDEVNIFILVKLEQLKNNFLNVDLIIINQTVKIFSMTLLFSESNGTSRLPSILLISTLYLFFSLILLLLITQELDSDGILLFHALLLSS